jgi:hypothetical protein
MTMTLYLKGRRINKIPDSEFTKGVITMEEAGIPFMGKEKTIDGKDIINLLRDVNYGDLRNLPMFTFKQSPKFSYGSTEVNVYILSTSEGEGFLKYITTVKTGENPDPVAYISDMHLSLFNTKQYAEMKGVDKHYVGEPIYSHIMQMIATYVEK